MCESLFSLLDEVKVAAINQGEVVINTLKLSNELIMDPDVKELINYISDNKMQICTYTHS